MAQHIINSDASLSKFIGDIRQEYAAHKFLRIRVSTGKDRTAKQNKQGHVWYEQLAQELREGDALHYKCISKLHCGVPLLREENEEFKEKYDKTIRCLTYEQKITVMEFLPVTSLMEVGQKTRYLQRMQEFWAQRGVVLMFLDDE